TVSDEHGTTDTQSLTVTITGDNDAVTAEDDLYGGAGRRALFVGEIEGLLTNDSDIDLGDVPRVVDVIGGTEETVLERIDGNLVESTRLVVSGDTGGRFAIKTDGSFVFDAGTDFDDVARGETRDTKVTYVVSDGKGAFDEGTVTVTVGAAATAPPPPGEGAPFDPTAAEAREVIGTFTQLGPTDVLSALTPEDGAIDLDRMLDLNLFDIDTTIEVSRTPTSVAISASDNNDNRASDPRPVVQDFGSKIDALVSVLAEFPNPLDAPSGPVFAGPEFDLAARIQAQLNWDIDLASLGQTAFFQPASFDFRLPNAPVEAGAQYQFFTQSMTAQSPTTALETVGLTHFEVGAGYNLAELRLKDVGFSIGTQDFLGLDIDGLFEGRLGLQGEIDLKPLAEAASPVPLAANFSFSAIDLLDGLATIGVADFVAAFDTFATSTSDTRAEAGKAVASEVDRALTAIGEVTAVTFTVGSGDETTELRASQIVDRFDRARFNDYDGFDEFGVGFFVEEGLGEDAVRLTRADIEQVLTDNDIDDAVARLREVFGADGLEIIEGLTIKATLPFGNVEEIEGFEDDGLGGRETADRAGPQGIEVEQSTRLFGVEVDFEKVALGLAKEAVDNAIEKALLNPTPATPKILLAGIGAKAALELAPQISGFVEQGFEDTTSIRPVELVATAFNPLIDVFNTLIGVVRGIPGVSAIPGNPLSTIPRLDSNSLLDASGNLAPAKLDAFGANLKAVLTGLAELPSDVFRWVVENPAVDLMSDALSSLQALNVGGAGSAINSILGVLGRYSIVDASVFTSALTKINEIATTGTDQATKLAGALGDFLGALSSMASNATGGVTNAIDQFVDFMISVARGFDLAVSAQFDMVDFTAEAGIDLVQIVEFDPDDVSVTYSSGGFDVETGLGEVATFIADGRPGETLEGQVTYGYSGEVDYDYRLRFDIEPVLKLLETHMQAQLSLGAGAQQRTYPINLDYAAVKITDEYGLDDLGSLNFASLFDEALFELPFGLAEEAQGLIFEQIQAQIGSFAVDQSGLESDELRLFKLEDVALGTDRFTGVSDSFIVEIAGVPDAPVAQLVFSEDAEGDVAADGLLDGINGTLAGVLDGALSIGRLLEIFPGLAARLTITRDGTALLDTNQSFEGLAVGQTATSEFGFTVDDPSGEAVDYTAELVVEGRNDAPVAWDDTATMLEDGTLRFNPLANDTDVDDGAVLKVISATSDFGTVTVEDEATIVFTPEANLFGEAAVHYVVADEHGATSQARVMVSIEGTPDVVTAVADSIEVGEDGPSPVDVTANDIEVDGQTVEVVGVTQPDRGILRLTDAGLVFDPAGEFEGLAAGMRTTETVLVTVADPDGSSTAELVLTILGRNDAPVGADDFFVLREDVAVV
ncbi:Ig-like domain-containing protein, partial [Aliiroseovarius subalbicans]|uniref:tandem-95 repeat protein n=1 Tax=Aliiroseovarius subalbicans TaxID=2925840 RepID=UPI001F56C9F6